MRDTLSNLGLKLELCTILREIFLETKMELVNCLYPILQIKKIHNRSKILNFGLQELYPWFSKIT